VPAVLGGVSVVVTYILHRMASAARGIPAELL